MADLPLPTLLNGASALAAFAIPLVFSVMFLISFLKHREKRLKAVVAMMFFALGFFFSGLSLSFVSLAVTGENIGRVAMGFLAYTLAPVGIMIEIYLGFNIFRPAFAKRVTLVYAVTGIVFLCALYGFPDLMIGGEEPVGLEMRDIALKSLCMYLIIFYILSSLVLMGGGFNHLRLRLTKRSPERAKVTWLLVGYVLFALGAIIETTIPSNYIVIARLIIVASHVFLYKGFSSTT